MRKISQMKQVENENDKKWREITTNDVKWRTLTQFGRMQINDKDKRNQALPNNQMTRTWQETTKEKFRKITEVDKIWKMKKFDFSSKKKVGPYKSSLMVSVHNSSIPQLRCGAKHLLAPLNFKVVITKTKDSICSQQKQLRTSTTSWFPYSYDYPTL